MIVRLACSRAYPVSALQHHISYEPRPVWGENVQGRPHSIWQCLLKCAQARASLRISTLLAAAGTCHPPRSATQPYGCVACASCSASFERAAAHPFSPFSTVETKVSLSRASRKTLPLRGGEEVTFASTLRRLSRFCLVLTEHNIYVEVALQEGASAPTYLPFERLTSSAFLLKHVSYPKCCQF